jgi:predicted outer membrane repeat protein
MRSTNIYSWSGVVRWDDKGPFICNNCSFVSCYSGGKGGVMNLNVAHENYAITNCDFFICAARDIGGAIQGSCKGITITSCKFFYNKAGKGGAIYISPWNDDIDGYGTDVNPNKNFYGNVYIISSSFVRNKRYIFINPLPNTYNTL